LDETFSPKISTEKNDLCKIETSENARRQFLKGRLCTNFAPRREFANYAMVATGSVGADALLLALLLFP
jgi:hypothetical protein